MTFRVVNISGGLYASEVEMTDADQVEDAAMLVGEGSNVIYVNSIEDLADIGIDPEVVQIKE